MCRQDGIGDVCLRHYNRRPLPAPAFTLCHLATYGAASRDAWLGVRVQWGTSGTSAAITRAQGLSEAQCRRLYRVHDDRTRKSERSTRGGGSALAERLRCACSAISKSRPVAKTRSALPCRSPFWLECFPRSHGLTNPPMVLAVGMGRGPRAGVARNRCGRRRHLGRCGR